MTLGKVVFVAALAFTVVPAQGGVVSVTGDAVIVAPPPDARNGMTGLSGGALFWNERQGVPVSSIAVDLLGSGTLFTDLGGFYSGVVDSHMVHADVTTAVTGVASGTATFSGPIVGIIALNPDATDALLGVPTTIYPAGDGGRTMWAALGGGVVVVGNSLSFEILVGSGEFCEFRVLTVPSAGVGTTLVLAFGTLARRRR